MIILTIYINGSGTTYNQYWSKKNKIMQFFMALIDLSVHSYSLKSVLSLEGISEWHLNQKMGVMFFCILSMQSLNYIRYIFVGLRLSWYSQYDDNFKTSAEIKQSQNIYNDR